MRNAAVIIKNSPSQKLFRIFDYFRNFNQMFITPKNLNTVTFTIRNMK